MATQILFLFLLYAVCAQDIIFEIEDDTCKLPNGGNGICRESRLCPEAYDNFPNERPAICGFVGRHSNVCCPVKTELITESPENIVSLQDISPPLLDFMCGDSRPVPLFPPGCPTCGVGGQPARTVLVKYSVLVGAKDSSGVVDWFCTGVLLNHRWVLTAAHCVIHRPIGVVRLGEHDYNDPGDLARPVDYDVEEVVLYPEFSHPQGYHDLALLKLSSQVTFGVFINPVCLPWGGASKRNLINEKISLTGWGATEFGGVGSSVLQEVNVTVFSTSFCDRSYSTLRGYTLVWPRGINDDVLCAGDPEGGKDACQGDSGGPVVYLNEVGQYVLAGVVSRGYGCGLKEFPGLYANIHHPPYLAWIKRVAFQ